MVRRRSRSNRHRLPLVAGIAIVLAAACGPAGTSGDASPNVAPASPSAPAPSGSADVESVSPSASVEPSFEPSPAEPVAWRQLEPGGPSPAAREDGTWTADDDGRTAYLFGGRDGSTPFDDVWAFDLGTDGWTELAPEGERPPARFGHEAVWVDDLGVVVFAGQAGPTTFFNDLWVYDPFANRWSELEVAGSRPKARYGSCASIGPDGRLWISHGFTEDGTRFADTQAFDFASREWSDVTPDGQAPVNRCLHGCWWTDDGRLALYAGQTTGVTALGDLWSLSGGVTPAAAWERVIGDLPPDRNLYAFARHGDAVVVVGGRGLDGFLDDAYTIDATTLAVAPLDPDGDPPPGRAGAMLIDDPARARVILFGGKTADESLDDLWQLELP